uniref:Uncharacterized protein n=1 Tax=Panagrolaimus sp. ES5 TaxID=591445 RepID=A0AC34FV67_9BILA
MSFHEGDDVKNFVGTAATLKLSDSTDILINQKALLQLLFENQEIYLCKDDFDSIEEAVQFLKYFYDKTLELSKRVSIISEIIPAFKKLKN